MVQGLRAPLIPPYGAGPVVPLSPPDPAGQMSPSLQVLRGSQKETMKHGFASFRLSLWALRESLLGTMKNVFEMFLGL